MPIFTGINYYVCCYCKYIRFFDVGHGGMSDECTIDNRHKRLEGCEKFSASGLPAYPSIYPELVKLNHLANTIPQDFEAVETSYEFIDNIKGR